MSQMDSYQEHEMGGSGIGSLIGQIPAILWQRKWFVLIPLLIGATLGTAAAFLLPKKYESSAVMVVQSPALPKDVVGMVNTDQIDRRIEAIRQQIITRPALLAVIEANNLYPKERRSKPLSTILDDMRASIVLVPEKVDLGNSRKEDDTISVRLNFTYDDAAKTQAVTQALMERIVEVNATTNTDQAQQTVQFLTDQQADVKTQIDQVEGELSALNSRYGNVIASNSAAVVSGGSAAYDMQISMLERDNASLRSQRNTIASSDTRDPAVASAETQLASLRATYSDNHPDVLLARRRLAEAKELARNNVAKIPTEAIDSQIAANNRQIAQLQALRSGDSARTSAVLAERSQAPAVQQQATQIQQRLKGLYEQYDAVSQRLLEAKAGEKANNEQMGERLLVVDPPVLPDRPTSPNRPLLIGLGIAAGLGLGLLFALAIEMFMRPVRDPATIRAITGARPLAMVPVVQPSPWGGRAQQGGRFRFLRFTTKKLR